MAGEMAGEMDPKSTPDMETIERWLSSDREDEESSGDDITLDMPKRRLITLARM